MGSLSASWSWAQCPAFVLESVFLSERLGNYQFMRLTLQGRQGALRGQEAPLGGQHKALSLLAPAPTSCREETDSDG